MSESHGASKRSWQIARAAYVRIARHDGRNGSRGIRTARAPNSRPTLIIEREYGRVYVKMILRVHVIER